MATQKAPEIQDNTFLAIAEANKARKNMVCINLEKGDRVASTASTGILSADLITGGGIQRGRIVDVFGPAGAGKTTILQEFIASFQRLKIPVVHYDPECAVDVTYAKTQGVNPQAVAMANKKRYPSYYYYQPSSGEEVYNHMGAILQRMPLIDPEKPGLPTVAFITDSLTAMVSAYFDPESEGKGGMALEPRMHSSYMKWLRGGLSSRGAVWIFSNQLRTNIGGYGAPSMEPGGKAVEYYPDYKIKITRKKIEDDKIGLAIQPFTLRTFKNKVFPPFREIDGGWLVGRGLDKAEDAKNFLKSIGKLENNRGKLRIMLKPFDKGHTSWRDFRAIAESPEFREHCFKLLQGNQVYRDYHETQQYLNYSYDQVPVVPPEVAQ